MKQVVVSIGDCKRLQDLLRSFEGLYLTCVVNRDQTFFCSSSMECYCHYSLTNISRENFDEMLIFRVPLKVFKNLVTEGTLVITISDDGDVEFKFSKYSFTFPLQYDVSDEIAAKLRVIMSMKSYPTVSLDGLDDIIHIGRLLNKDIIFNDDIVFIQCPNMQIYKKKKVSRFTLSPKYLALLCKYSYIVYNVGNYIGCVDENVAILVTKLRSFGTCDSDFITSQKTYYAIKFNIDNMIRLIKKVSLNDGILELDFNKRSCLFDTEKISFKTDIDILDVKTREDVKVMPKVDFLSMIGKDLSNGLDLSEIREKSYIPSVIVPSSVAKFLGCLRIQNCILYVKKNYLVLRSGDLNVIFKGLKEPLERNK